MINKTFHCKFPETCMENRKTREDLTKANTDLMFEVEELTKLVASLEEVRAKEYAFKQAKVEVLKRDNAIINAEWERSTGVWQEEVSKLKARVRALEAELRTEIAYHAGTDSHYRARRMRAVLQENGV